MDYQKLAKMLLRVLSAWLLVQSIPQLSGALYSLSQLSNRTGGMTSGLVWLAPVMAGMTIVVSIVLFSASDWLSKAITRDL